MRETRGLGEREEAWGERVPKAEGFPKLHVSSKRCVGPCAGRWDAMYTSVPLLHLHPLLCTLAALKYIKPWCFLCVFSYEIAQAVVNGRCFKTHPEGFFSCVYAVVCVSASHCWDFLKEPRLCVESLMLQGILPLCHKLGTFGNYWFYSVHAKWL